MNNPRGITLIELLAVLSLVGIILILVISVLINGLNSSDRTSTNQRLQQEANYIMETIRKEYLMNTADPFSVRIETISGGQRIYVSNRLVSETYNYQFNVDNGDGLISGSPFEIKRVATPEINLVVSDGTLKFSVSTKLSKIQ